MFKRTLVTSVALTALCHGNVALHAQEVSETSNDVQLPVVEIDVSTPSPVVKNKKRKKKKTAPTPATTATNIETELTLDTTSEETTSELLAPLPGTLLVVDDAFVPVTVVTEREILSGQGATITDVLDQKPGIIGSNFAPGASRPIVRGLDNQRVRVQQNGIGSQDLSALSEDHAVLVDPLLATQVEVIRGPATLRYGSSAIGGVVAVENDRIPSAVPRNGVSGEVRGGLSSVDAGKDVALRATAGAQGVVVTGDYFNLQKDDYDTPRGTQFNSFVESEGVSFGTSFVGRDGYIGIAVSRHTSFYGIPTGDDEEALEERPRIDLEQDKILLKGEWSGQNNIGLEAIRFWFGASNYNHNEVVDEGGSDAVGQVFSNDEIETRVEVQHTPIQLPFGSLSGAAGTQFVTRELSGIALEDADSLLLPTRSTSIAGFLFEELELNSRITLQAAGRIEHVDVEGSGRSTPFNVAVPPVDISRRFTPVSTSLGVLNRLQRNVVFSLNGQYIERAPTPAELFSSGIHEATGTFELGNAQLNKEKAFTVEAGFRRALGALRFDTTAFYSKFDGFIFRSLTGTLCGETLDSCGVEDELDQVLFVQKDATFFGVELAAQYDVSKLFNGVWGIEGQYDFVRAKLDDGENVPRIPPHRIGGGVYYKDPNWLAKAGVIHAFDQNDIAQNEIATPGYTLVLAELSYTNTVTSPIGVDREYVIGIKGENLGDDEVLNHASFRRADSVLQPGANVRVFGKLKFN